MASGHGLMHGRVLDRDHQNFEESTEVIVPLTEEEKKAKLEELREKYFPPTRPPPQI